MATTTRSAPSHKERLLKHGMKQFYATGYHGTSVDTVLDEAGVPKGSFYHHFGGKEAFAMAVVREYRERNAGRLEKWSQDSGLSAPERLQGYIEDMAHAMDRRGNRQGCLIGKFTSELAPSSDPFSAVLSTMLAAWQSSVQAIVSEGQSAGTIRCDLPASDLASLVLWTIQGAIVLSLAHRSSEPMRSAARTVKTLISV